MEDICPKCNSLQYMKLSSEKKEEERDGKSVSIETTSFHCGQCNSFVKSEDTVVG